MENNFRLDYYDSMYTVHVQFSHYQHDGGLAVMLTCDVEEGHFDEKYCREELFAIISVCLVDDPILEPDTFWVDTNNCPWAVDFLIDNGIAKLTGHIGYSGYCEYPQVQLTPEWRNVVYEIEN